MLFSNSPTLGEELGEYFIKNFFNPQLPYFRNLPNDIEGYQIVILIGAVLLGVVFAAFAFVFQKKVVGKLPRALIAAEATSEETAKTMQELGIKADLLTELYLNNPQSALRKTVRFVGQQDLTYEEMSQKKSERRIPPKPDSASSRFYIPAEKVDRMAKRYSEKGNTWRMAALLAVGCVALFFVLCGFLPEIMQLVDNAAGIF
jgi:hypothetical protein